MVLVVTIKNLNFFIICIYTYYVLKNSTFDSDLKNESQLSLKCKQIVKIKNGQAFCVY